MTANEQWQAWRGAESAGVSIDDYLAWVAELTNEENDIDGLFISWRVNPEREAVLRCALGNEIVGIGHYNQVFLGLFYGLYQILQGRKCFVVSGQQMPLAVLRGVIRRLGMLGKLNIRMLGACMGGEHVYLGDCQNVDLVLADYYQFMGSLRRNREQFVKTVQSVFFLDIDVTLYDTRLVLLERGVERAAALIYKSPSSLPENWLGNPNHVDSPLELNELETLPIAGSYSYTDKYSMTELVSLMPKKLKKFPVKSSRGYVTLSYRTNQARVSALVSDVMKTEGDALIVSCTPEVCRLMLQEFQKSGQECIETANTLDCVTFFTPSAGQVPRKKVIVLHGNPSTLVMPPKPLTRGAVYIAEHFLAQNMHEKSVAAAEALFEQTAPARLYMSLEDMAVQQFAQKNVFKGLFDLIDFTEKYDPWRQIRRVLGKCAMSRLHALRVEAADITQPTVVSLMNTKNVMDAIAKEKPKRLSKLDAPCFCGSGKPFRECHGKLQK